MNEDIGDDSSRRRRKGSYNEDDTEAMLIKIKVIMTKKG